MQPLLETTLKLRTYTGETLQIHGAITVDVTYNDQTDTLALLVVEGTGPSLMGRDWLTKIGWIGETYALYKQILHGYRRS